MKKLILGVPDTCGTPTDAPESTQTLRQLCADLSLRCPGFAILRQENGKVTVERLCHLKSNPKMPHGEVLKHIYDLLMELSVRIDIFVRERAFSRFTNETQALSKVIGIADLTAWQSAGAVYEEIAPAAIKKRLVGNGKASKGEVASVLEQYVGKQDYATDDESDAVAVGIAWLKR